MNGPPMSERERAWLANTMAVMIHIRRRDGDARLYLATLDRGELEELAFRLAVHLSNTDAPSDAELRAGLMALEAMA